jgi:hypothetical protein
MASTAVLGGDQSTLAAATAKRAETLRTKPEAEIAEPALTADGVEEVAAPLGEPELEPGAAVLALEVPATVVILDGAAPGVVDGAAPDVLDASTVAGVVVAAGADVGAGVAEPAAPANCTGKAVLYCSVVCETAG